MQKKLYSWFFKKEYNANDTETEFPGAVRKLLDQYPKCQENIKKLFCGEHFPPCFPDESPRVYSLCQPLCDQIATDCPGFFRQVCNVIYFFQGEPAGEGKDRVGVGNMYGAVVRFSDPSPSLPPPLPPSVPSFKIIYRTRENNESRIIKFGSVQLIIFLCVCVSQPGLDRLRVLQLKGKSTFYTWILSHHRMASFIRMVPPWR